MDNHKNLLVWCQADRIWCLLCKAAPHVLSHSPVRELKTWILVTPVSRPHPVGIINSDTIRNVEPSQALTFLPMNLQHFKIIGQLDKSVVHATITIYNVNLSWIMDKDFSWLVKQQWLQTRSCLSRCSENLKDRQRNSLSSAIHSAISKLTIRTIYDIFVFILYTFYRKQRIMSNNQSKGKIKEFTCSSFPEGDYCLMQWPYGPFPTSVIHTVGSEEATISKKYTMRHFQGGVPVPQEISICLENKYFGHIVICSSIKGVDDRIQQDKLLSCTSQQISANR